MCSFLGTPPPAFIFLNRLPLLPTLIICFISIVYLGSSYLYWYPSILVPSCAHVLLSWYALRGQALRPPPCTPSPAFTFNRLPLLPTILFFISIIVYLGSFYLYWYPSILVPMYFFLGMHCGGRRCALPLTPPPAFIFFNRLPLLPTLIFCS